ncbi:MAG: AraC family transcriptional regulator [Clostridia bacterium]|nr:AraC family transcriptional regulator [Clostridia bacterium]
MEAWHQKNIVDSSFPFNLIITDMAEFPPHWHEEIEIIYVLDETLKVGLNNEVYCLNPRDILLAGAGDVHSFIPQPKRSRRIILQFELSVFESFSTVMRDRRFLSPLIRFDRFAKSNPDFSAHKEIEAQILQIAQEYQKKQEGYKIALKARLYDLLVVLLRQVPMEKYSQRDKRRHLNRLERLEQVFKYVEDNFDREIGLDEVARIANFSLFHFTRFFKEATGMTFIEYLNNLRISKAVFFLDTSSDSVTEVAFKSGFNSIKTFNRVFKQLKGCSPTSYRKSNII